MTELNKRQLNEILDKHEKWLNNNGGKKADLRHADLRLADLRLADLRLADLSGVDLSGAELPPYERLPDSGSFTAYKGAGGYVVRLRVPADAGRVSCLTGPKCRVEYAVVKEILDTDGETADVDSVRGNYDPETVYEAGEEVHPDEYDGDIRLECSHGIHCFPTFREATEWI